MIYKRTTLGVPQPIKRSKLPAALLVQRAFMIMAVILSFFGSLASLGNGLIILLDLSILWLTLIVNPIVSHEPFKYHKNKPEKPCLNFRPAQTLKKNDARGCLLVLVYQ